MLMMMTKGEALRLPHTNSSEKKFKLKSRILEQVLLNEDIQKAWLRLHFEARKQALLQKCKKDKRIMSFRHTIPSYGA